MHPAEIRVWGGNGRQQALPNPGQVPATEAAAVVGMTGANLGIPA